MNNSTQLNLAVKEVLKPASRRVLGTEKTDVTAHDAPAVGEVLIHCGYFDLQASSTDEMFQNEVPRDNTGKSVLVGDCGGYNGFRIDARGLVEIVEVREYTEATGKRRRRAWVFYRPLSITSDKTTAWAASNGVEIVENGKIYAEKI